MTEMTWNAHAHGLRAHVRHERIWLRSCWEDSGVVGKIPWRRKWQPSPVFLTEKFHGQRARQATVHRVAESDTTEAT